MERLPDEIILTILAEHVATSDLPSCRLVCRRWRRMFSSRALRRYHNARFEGRSPNSPMDHDMLSYVDLDARSTWRDEIPLHAASAIGNLKNVEVLLRRMASQAGAMRLLDATDRRGKTPLSVATAHGNIGVAKSLLEHGANVNTHDVRGETPLHAAVVFGNVEMVRLLLSHGAHVDVIDCYQMTPLHFAASIKRHSNFKGAAPKDHPAAIEIVRMLLDGGSDLAAVCVHGQTPLHLAALWGSEILELILARSIRKCQGRGKRSPLPRATSQSSFFASPTPQLNIESVSTSSVDEPQTETERTVEHPANVRDNAGHTPLHRAAEAGNSTGALAILRHASADSPTLPRGVRPVDLNALTRVDRLTPLHRAAEVGSADCVRALLAAGAKATAQDAKGRTPLDYVNCSNYRGGLDCARKLIRAGAVRGILSRLR